MAVFPFFRLPRERRDQIYAECRGRPRTFHLECPFDRPREVLQDDSDDKYFYEDTIVEASVSPSPLQSMLLVSRAFREEYEKQTRRNMVLHIGRRYYDVDYDWNPSVLDENELLLKCIRWIPKLVISNCDTRFGLRPDLEEFEKVRDYVAPFMPNLKTIANDFVFTIDGTNPDNKAPDMLKEIFQRDAQIWTAPTGTNVVVNINIYLRSAQFRLHKSFDPTTHELWRSPLRHEVVAGTFARYLVEHRKENQIVFFATAAGKQNEFWGLELSVFNGSPIDLSEMIYEGGAEYGRMAGEVEVDYDGDDDDEIFD